MKVLGMQVHHVGCINDIDFDLSGHNLFLVGGRNGNGKTVAIKSLLMALCGRREMGEAWPAKPLKDGEEEGWVKVHLSGDEEMHDERGFVAELHFTRKRDGGIREEFVLTDADGDPAPEPRTLLNRLYSMTMFDPTAFDRLRPKEQRAELARLFPELDFSEIDKQIKDLFEERTIVNREGKSLKARFDAMPHYANVPEREVVVTELMAELKRRQEHNRANEDERLLGNNLATEVAQYASRIDETEEDIELIEKELKAKRNELRQWMATKKAADADYAAHIKKIETLKDEDITEVEQQIADAENTNRAVRENAERKRIKAELDTSRDKWQELTDSMKALEDEKQKTLREASLPVAGLAIDSEGVLYQGRPFSDANKATRFLVGCMIGMSGDEPKLPLLVCEHGDGLDWETMEAFDAMLRERNWQAVVEVTSRSESDDERCQVVMFNGSVVLPKKRKSEIQ